MLRLFLAIVSLVTITGCASHAVIEKAWPNDIEAGSLEGITDVHWAAYDGEENILLCLRGKAHSDETFKPADFMVSVSTEAFGIWAKEEKRWCRGASVFDNPIPKKILPASGTLPGCPDLKLHQKQIPVIAIKPSLTKSDCSSDSLKELHDHIVSRQQPVAVYVGPSYGWASRVFLRRDSSSSASSRIIELDFEPQRKTGNKAWLLALPITVPFDIVTGPFIAIYVAIGIAITGDSL